jgi:HlyD family secretion protein
LNIEEGVVLEPNAAIGINRYHPVVLEQRTITAAKTTIFSKSKNVQSKLMFCRSNSKLH